MQQKLRARRIMTTIDVYMVLEVAALILPENITCGKS